MSEMREVIDLLKAFLSESRPSNSQGGQQAAPFNSSTMGGGGMPSPAAAPPIQGAHTLWPGGQVTAQGQTPAGAPSTAPAAAPATGFGSVFSGGGHQIGSFSPQPPPIPRRPPPLPATASQQQGGLLGALNGPMSSWQNLASHMGGRGGVGGFANIMSGLQNAMGGQFNMGQIGGMIGGQTGSLISSASGGPVGMAIHAIKMAKDNIDEGFAMQRQGFGQAVSSGVTANATGAMKGGVNFAAGAISTAMGPILGPMVRKLAGVIGGVIDSLDGLTKHFSQYNGRIAAAEGQYEAAQARTNIKMGQAMAPMLENFSKVKIAVLKVADAFAPVISFLSKIGGGLLSSLATGLEWLAKGFEFGIKAIKVFATDVLFGGEKIREYMTFGIWKARERSAIEKEVNKAFGTDGDKMPSVNPVAAMARMNRAGTAAHGGGDGHGNLVPGRGLDGKGIRDRKPHMSEASHAPPPSKKGSGNAEGQNHNAAAHAPVPNGKGLIPSIEQQVNFSLSAKLAMDNEIFDMMHSVRQILHSQLADARNEFSLFKAASLHQLATA